MAKIHTESIIVTLSKLIKSGANENDVESLLTEELITAVEQIAQELAGDGVIVEVSGVAQE